MKSGGAEVTNLQGSASIGPTSSHWALSPKVPPLQACGNESLGDTLPKPPHSGVPTYLVLATLVYSRSTVRAAPAGSAAGCTCPEHPLVMCPYGRHRL